MKLKHTLVFLMLLSALALVYAFTDTKPVIYLIGDSTVKNGKGNGDNQLWGWGSFLSQNLDTTKVHVENCALGGTSSRTFKTKGLWTEVFKKLKPGDIVIIQFGHNDGGQLDDTARARGTLRGTGNETREIFNPLTKKQEVVHTFGWYISGYIRDARSKGATAVVCSPVPRNIWKNKKVVRDIDSYPKWAKEAADSGGAYFIDLHNMIADRYDQLGEDRVSPFFPADHTHTNMEGAKLNASSVAQGLGLLQASIFKPLMINQIN